VTNDRYSAAVRLLLATDDYWPNRDGGALFQRRLARSLARDLPVRVWAPSLDGPGSVGPDGRTTVRRFRSRALRANPRYRVSRCRPAAFWRDFRAWRPEVVHVHNPGWLGLFAVCASALTGVAVVGTNHLVAEHVFLNRRCGPTSRVLVERLTWAYLRWFHNRCDEVTAPSHHARSLLLLHGVTRPVHVISNGVDTAFFSPAAPDTGRPGRPLTLVYIGRLDRDKRVADLLRSVAAASAARPLVLTVVGDGSARVELEQLADRLVEDAEPGRLRIEFTGYVSENTKRDHLRGSDVFCMPSPYELQCIAALEAMACGLPVLAPASGALPELCEDGVTGWAYEVGDAEACARRLRDLDRGEARRRGAKARARAVRDHDHGATVERYREVFAQLAPRQRGTVTK
jgi:glycosyltransferase involved in cell wall biosynthesis